MWVNTPASHGHTYTCVVSVLAGQLGLILFCGCARKRKASHFSKKHINAAALQAGSVALDVDVTVLRPTMSKFNQKNTLAVAGAHVYQCQMMEVARF